ncbi:MAG: NAD(P)-dependent glycerol-3-phosphate dehydrogenase [Gammaproteobacteria bacterium]|nr:NAD(P)-dependent glycerol-3-phosphate dehydrogenase [Gammaproteobacteria bacterium]MBU1776023.1 NAD(P)-dependent glycerol-3-phosphate dehydrogenase [Gammaproteobacteria bacterium]MBU1968377.1 NAD(P)-dependent glycerol-3-phosphate dehydrogenase [Gammaproteobacteria bacterium]
MKIAILGSGAWGTALAVSFAPRHQVTLWSREEVEIEAMVRDRCNQRFLPDIPLPDQLMLSTSLNEALAGAELAIVAVPVAGLRGTLQQLARQSSPIPVIWVCKGFESETSLFPHQVAEQILPASFPRGVLSGPSFAQEVARSQPTAMTLASNDGEFAQRMAQALHHSRLRIYSSTDVVGVEIGGAVKNVLAIAAGICDGMKMGLNARAALLTRGLAEMTRLGLQMGGKAETLGGLSGVGDLILTCTGDLSRNRQVGMLLAQHKSLANILSELGHVAEGVYTAREVHFIAQQHGVDMPICDAVYRVLYEDLPADQAVEALLSRKPGSEFIG